MVWAKIKSGLRPSQSSGTFVIRSITVADLLESLQQGWEDFKAFPTHAVVLAVIYPVLGLALARMAQGMAVLPLLFPLAAGFAILGPFAALGLYELSRRRDMGEEPSASDALQVFRSPAIGSIFALGAVLLVLFLAWVAAAQSIYQSTFGFTPASDIPGFVTQVLTTAQGFKLIVVGCGVGLLFAVASFCLSVVSFPLMLDRNANIADSVLTSLRAVAQNPVTMAVWGLVVAGLLVVGTLPFFLGLTVVIPVLGHATWHLYRKLIVPN
jgi:uncharacterized membrane protein